jgi:hypothetical protein
MNITKTHPINKYAVKTHVSWSFNDVPYARICNSEDFKFVYNLGDAEVNPDLKSEIRSAIIGLHTESKLRLSICIGGADSEIIAREAAYLGIPFDIYFLDLWDVNRTARKHVIDIGKELGAMVNVESLSKVEAYDTVIPLHYSALQAEKPTYLCLPFLLDKIPKDTYIVGGEGDPQKSGPDYAPFANENGKFDGLPVSVTEVFYRQWAIDNERISEMYFYSSTPGLIKSYYYHPLIELGKCEINTRNLVDGLWPELVFKSKTTNWEEDFNVNTEIRKYTRTLGNFKNKLPRICLVKI